MKGFIKLCFPLIALFFLAAPVKGSHVAGGDFQWVNVGQDSFLITFNFFRDCSGIPAPTSVTFQFTSTCGGSQNVVVQQDTFFEVSQLCQQQITNSTCNNGFLPGMQQYIYTELVVLTPPCNTWNVAVSISARNGATNSGFGQFYLNATMYSANDPTNNSPAFNATPIPYVCAFQTVNYNFGVNDVDNDSVVYSLTPALIGPGNPIAYTGPYSATQPIIGIVLNTQTGLLTFTPTTLGNFVVVVTVMEYDRNTGQLLSVVRRDLQFYVITCNNQLPTTLGIDSITGTAILIDSNSLQTCWGDSFTAYIPFADTDTIDSLQITSDITTVLPGSSFSLIQGPGTNNTTAVLSWIAQPGSNAFTSFTVNVDDGACPTPGLLSLTFDIVVLNSVYAGEDTIICGVGSGQSAQLSGAGAPTLTWSVISGPPMVVGTNFSCNPCDDPVASPTATTTYLLSGVGYTGICDSVDTVTVTVVPNFDPIMPNDTLICNIDTVPISASVTPVIPGIVWNWDNGGSLDDDSSLVTLGFPDVTTTYTLTGVSPDGCIREDTFQIEVAPPFPANIQAVAQDSLICITDGTLFTADLGFLIPTQCGINPNGCLGNASDVTVGLGTTTNTFTSFPAIFGGFFDGAKHQYLYTATDLAADGMIGGSINGISFFVESVGQVIAYQNFEIKMRCTNQSSITTWAGGMTTVFPGQTVQVQQGWNYFQFPAPFDYDGQTDLIVEFCFNNNNSALNGNSRIRYTNTTYQSSLHYFQYGQGICNVPGAPTVTTSRVNLRFEICSGTDPLAYNYQWTPGTDLSVTTAHQPAFNPSVVGNYNYQVIITDTFGVCSDTTDTLPVEVVDEFDASFSSQSPYCITANPDTLGIVTGGGTWVGPGLDTNGVFTATNAGVGTHQVIYTVGSNSGGCINSDTAFISVAGAPNTSILTTGPFCESDLSVNLNAAFPGGTWGGIGVTDTTLGIFNPSLFNAPDSAVITYSRDSICPGSSSVTVYIISQLDPSITPVSDPCIDDVAFNMLPAGDPGGVWSGTGIINAGSGTFSPSTAGIGTHTISYTLPGSCGGTGTFDVTVNALPLVGITGILPTYCDNNTALVTPDGGTSGGTWIGPTGVSSSNGTFVPSNVGSNTNPYQLIYTVTDGNQCTNADTFQFTVYNTPAPPSLFSSTYCEGDAIDDLLATGNGNNTISWYDDVNLTNLVANGTTYDPGTATASFDLWLTQTSPAPEECESDPLQQTITVVPTPPASFTATPTQGAVPLLVSFTNTTNTSGGPYAYLWDFDDGTTSTAVDPDNTFADFGDGVYTVVLTATDGFGCVGTFSTDIIVEAEVELSIPNVFTPNGDMNNDEFIIDVVKGEQSIVDYQGLVFNRWGRKVGELNNSTDTWDGNDMGGSQVSDGVYFYVINVTSVDGREYRFSGEVTLLRAEK